VNAAKLGVLKEIIMAKSGSKGGSNGPNVWVGPNPKGSGWQVKPEGKKPIAIKPTQKEAQDVGRKVAEKNGSELITQGRDGQIRDKDSHGNETSKPDKNGKK
jgi:hypothetical protein